MTCHIAYDKPGYEDHPEPLKTHPRQKIIIGKHPPERTGCTWCHKGQGSATAPTEDAHGSHHEMDQSTGINEPIVHEQFIESQCMNCHAEVIHLEGADELSHGRELFLELGCHGCHLADGFQDAKKVGPGLFRLASKVNATWLYKWIKNPKGYLPKTRMPNFGLDNKDALAVTAYLMASSEKGYTVSNKFKSGDAENGKKLFETVGCQACHSVNGKGEEFAPDLSNIAAKVNVDWLVSWVDNPSHYNPKSKMPNLRVGIDNASDIAAYLIQFGKPKHIKGIEARIRSKEFIAHGEKVVRRRGCFACHDIKGMEKEGRIAPELSSFGGKQTWELEFGDTHIPHTWESWASTKLRKPNSFRTERVLDKMPNFGLSEAEINSLLVLLKGWNGLNIPENYKHHLTSNQKAIETGRRIIDGYNCRGCHIVEGTGGVIQKYIKAKSMYPPPLERGDYHVGERIKSSWIFSFLQQPTPVRTWLKVKMPTFNFTENEAMGLTAYFEALIPGNKEHTYETGQNVERAEDSIKTGIKMANYMDCGNCHDEGDKGIDFSIASARLKHEWIPRWLKNTRDLIPETKMPSHWPKKGDTYVISSKFSDLEDVEGGNIDRQIDRLTDYIVSYNTTDVSVDEEEGDDEDGDDEEGGDDEIDSEEDGEEEDE
jgi:cytochrome c2